MSHDTAKQIQNKLKYCVLYIYLLTLKGFVNPDVRWSMLRTEVC